MKRHPSDPNDKLLMSRRGMLLSGATLLAGSFAASLCPGISLAAIDAGAQSRFMQLSSLLINHGLNPEVGARIAETASGQYPNFAGMLDAIIAIADKKHAAQVEDFFNDIPEGELRDFAHWVIFAWYSGCSSDKRDAKVFTYEEALTFKTTSDVVTIPSYGISGPNLWTRPNVPLSAPMPRF
ncbi:sugar dehydrogenase complex small subunit [Neorhizobium sp. NPDC001467]|uniref:sugar dehydrogenase complex small subunit n=1 Tax=Neorhizobium sp. NPDC001467 TaxID=3390595 RepID=UPI003D03AB67